ncbi:DNA adenine methylase [Acidovorax sp. NCPPB 3576]|uniref:DNA adenine methylase n=1 Tax=Acidovorax sp. NCPPB 3576 TaxID=2940488 RepID=UPI0023491C63|nr:DNA adenine methylase [Acidovorax sp. NCPPB 3576]WCM88287.1 DNA adenine methylase [Acidovorax sp. NCPPB 3576]
MQTELAESWEAEELALDVEASPIISASSAISRRFREDAQLSSREVSAAFGEPIPFPTTRYYGSKRRQMGWLREEFGRLEGCTALDAFGGTGAVSHLLSQMGWDVTYNDIFQFNTISARALFSSARVPLSTAGVASILRTVKPRPGFIHANFAGLYFTDEENAWLDGFMTTLTQVEPACKDLLLHCLFQACLKKRPYNLFHRANLKLRQSRVKVQFGNRTTWEKSFAEHILSTFEEVRHMQRGVGGSVTVTAGRSAEEIIPGYDFVYVDPPYFKRTRDTESYLSRYHFLEGLARYDEWPQLLDGGDRLQRIKASTVSEWTSKAALKSDIAALIQTHRNAKFALSYVSGEHPSEAELFDLFCDNFSRVRLSRRAYSRALSKKKFFELLLIGEP